MALNNEGSLTGRIAAVASRRSGYARWQACDLGFPAGRARGVHGDGSRWDVGGSWDSLLVTEHRIEILDDPDIYVSLSGDVMWHCSCGEGRSSGNVVGRGAERRGPPDR